jgi:hypothetical protein
VTGNFDDEILDVKFPEIFRNRRRSPLLSGDADVLDYIGWREWRLDAERVESVGLERESAADGSWQIRLLPVENKNARGSADLDSAGVHEDPFQRIGVDELAVEIRHELTTGLRNGDGRDKVQMHAGFV